MYIGHGCCVNRKFPGEFVTFKPDKTIRLGECQRKVYAPGFVGAVIMGNSEPGTVGLLQCLLTWIPGVLWVANRIGASIEEADEKNEYSFIFESLDRSSCAAE